jgi:poly(hydroxyalkanoate) depolymerase family esterase
MNPDFQRLMSRATLQTRGGDLLGATATIQRALTGTSEADLKTFDDVIDVDAEAIDHRLAEIGTDNRVRASQARDGGLHEERFLDANYGSGRVSINYKLYVPPGDPFVPRPLLVMLHGCTQDPDDFAMGTRMNEAARRNGWLVLYPEQSARVNPQRCWSWFKTPHQARGRGEPALLASLTHHVMSNHQVDARHVHVAGLSAGAAMAAVLGQAYPDLFASIGVHSGLPCGAVANAHEALEMMRTGRDTRKSRTTGASCIRAVPTIVFHGTRDTTVHPLNAELVYADAVSGQPSTERVEHGREGERAYTRRTRLASDDRSLAELWLIEGAGHAWSGGDQRGSHADWQGPDAAEQMICFFSAHPRTGEL